MTFRVYFFAEQAFLAQVKLLSNAVHTSSVKEIETGAVCVLACAAAVESLTNSLLINNVKFKHFDELRLASKIEYIGEYYQKPIDWGDTVWQQIAALIRLRNWLSHYKDSNVGLIGAEGKWLIDTINKLPKIDPDIELSSAKIKNYYKATLAALKQLVLLCQAELEEFSYLETEDFQSSLVG